MRLHAHLAQALLPAGDVPGQERLRFAQLPGVASDEAAIRALAGDAERVEEVARILEERGDARAVDVKKAVRTWGRIELVDASFRG